MRIIMFRHAERDSSGGSNPPLSSRGLRQAQKLVEEIDVQNLPLPTKLFSSPKLRAQQTLLPIEAKLGVEVQIEDDLDERQSGESAQAFTRRVQKFLAFLERQGGVVYFVSHLDWIEEACSLIHADTDLTQDRFQSFSPAQSVEFEVHDRLWVFLHLRTSQI